MKRGAQVAIAVTLLTCGSAVAQGMWNQSGPDTGRVTLTLGREASLVSGREGTTAQSVRLWLGPEGVTSAPVTDRAWLDAVGFGTVGEISTARPCYAVLDVGAEPGADGLTVVGVGREPAELLARYPDRSRYLVTPASIRSRIPGAQGDSLGTIYLTPNALHVPRGAQAGTRVEVRTGRSGIPFVVGGR